MKLTQEMIEKAKAAKCAEAQELSDEMLDGVAGGFGLQTNSSPDDMDDAAKGLVQLINPSSGRL